MQTREARRKQALERNEAFYRAGKSKNPPAAKKHINDLRRKLGLEPLPEAK